MKIIILLVLTLVNFVTAHSDFKVLSQKLDTSFRNKSLENLETAFLWTDVHIILKDQQLLMLRDFLELVKSQNLQLLEIKYTKENDLPEFSREFIRDGLKIGNRSYILNIRDIKGSFDITFRDIHNKEIISSISLYVGLTEDKKWFLASKKMQINQ